MEPKDFRFRSLEAVVGRLAAGGVGDLSGAVVIVTGFRVW